MDKSLAGIARNWTAWEEKDPLYAVLSEDGHKGNLWDLMSSLPPGGTRSMRFWKSYKSSA